MKLLFNNNLKMIIIYFILGEINEIKSLRLKIDEICEEVSHNSKKESTNRLIGFDNSKSNSH